MDDKSDDKIPSILSLDVNGGKDAFYSLKKIENNTMVTLTYNGKKRICILVGHDYVGKRLENFMFKKINGDDFTLSFNRGTGDLLTQKYRLTPIFTPSGIHVSQLKNLKENDDNYLLKNTHQQFVWLTTSQIEEKGGTILAQKSQGEPFVGIALDSNNVLHICPGGGYPKMNVNDFEELMPKAVQNLDGVPEGWVVDGPRHKVGNTGEEFVKWQQSLK